MIKIQDEVRKIVYAEEEALYALAKGYMNLSAYAKQIKKRVEEEAMKGVKASGIVVALSRMQKELKNIHPLIQNIKINNVTIKSPLSELVFEKKLSVSDKLSSLYKNIKTNNDDFLTMTLSTSEITIICSDRIKENVLKELNAKPSMTQSGLASIGISLGQEYYKMPNITYSLIRRIARKKIVLAETISTHAEIIFVFYQKDLPEMVTLFEA